MRSGAAEIPLGGSRLGGAPEHCPRLGAAIERVQRLGAPDVSDGQLAATIRFFAERMKMVVEPTGCLAAAALLHGVVPAQGLRVGVILSGGNVDLARYAALLSGVLR